MNRTQTVTKIYLIIIAVSALAAAVCGSVAMWTSYDTAIGYLNVSPLSTALAVIAAVAVVAMVVLPFFIPRGGLSAPAPLHEAPLTTRILRFLVAASAIVGGIMSWLSRTQAPTAFGVENAALVDKLHLWSVIFSILAAAYFILICFPAIGKRPTVSLLLGFLPIIWAFLIIGATYFDMTVTMNSPSKLAIQFGYAAIMLVMTTEQRLHLGEFAPRLALTLHGLAVLVCLSAGCMMTLSLGVTQDTATFGLALPLFFFGLYACKRLVDSTRSPHVPSDGETPASEDESVMVDHPAPPSHDQA